MGDVTEAPGLRAELNPSHHGPEWKEDGERRQYRVTEQTVRESTDESIGSEGLHYNGVIYTPGDELEMNAAEAAAFVAHGDLEEV